jgi:hypothetical protein
VFKESVLGLLCVLKLMHFLFLACILFLLAAGLVLDVLLGAHTYILKVKYIDLS